MARKQRKRRGRPPGRDPAARAPSPWTQQTFDEARRLHETGDPAGAEDGYRRALKRTPEFAPASYGLGLLLNQQGRHTEAIKVLRTAAALAPGEPAVHYELARANLATGALERAREHNRRAAALAPGTAGIARLEAEINERLNDIASAIASYEALLKIGAGNAPVYNNLGILYRRRGEHAQALAAYDSALALNPAHAQAWNNRGNVLGDLGDRTGARSSYEQAIRLDGSYLEALCNLALLEQQSGRLEAALVLYERTLTLAPDHQYAGLQKAETLLSAGRFVEARDCLGGILERDARCAEAYYLYAQSKRFSRDDDALLQRVERIRATGTLSDAQCVYLDFTLGKLYDDAARYDEAFGCYARGNRRERARMAAAVTADLAPVCAVIDACPAALFDAAPAPGPTTAVTPIFVVGMPRSGTTLVEQTLARHPDVRTAGELDFFPRTTRTLHEQIGSERRYPANVAELTAGQRAAIAARFLVSATERAGDARYVIDKMPDNFMHLGLIRRLFPGARIVHCRRHPLDTCVSIYFQLFASEHAYAYDLDDIARRYLDYVRVMTHWRAVFGESLYELDYEALVLERADTVRALLDYCGLSWHEAVLAPERGTGPVATASRWQVRQPVYRHALWRWQHYAAQIGPLRGMLADLLRDETAAIDAVD